MARDREMDAIERFVENNRQPIQSYIACYVNKTDSNVSKMLHRLWDLITSKHSTLFLELYLILEDLHNVVDRERGETGSRIEGFVRGVDGYDADDEMGEHYTISTAVTGECEEF